MIPNWRCHMTVWTQCTLNFSQTWCSIAMYRHGLRMNANVLMAWPLLQHYHWFGICTCEPEECQNLTYILYWNWDNTFVLSRELMSTQHLSWTWDLLRAVPSWIDSWDSCSHELLYETNFFCLVSLQMSHSVVCIPLHCRANRVVFYYLACNVLKTY